MRTIVPIAPMKSVWRLAALPEYGGWYGQLLTANGTGGKAGVLNDALWRWQTGRLCLRL